MTEGHDLATRAWALQMDESVDDVCRAEGDHDDDEQLGGNPPVSLDLEPAWQHFMTLEHRSRLLQPAKPVAEF